MTTIEAILLGVIQGATEFLPISSSGHLLLIPSLFNLAEPDLNAIAIAHQGTLLAILVYFRGDLWRITLAVANRFHIELSVVLIRIERGSSRPFCFRSSVTIASPAATAWLGCRNRCGVGSSPR